MNPRLSRLPGLVVGLFGCLVVWLFGCLAVWSFGCLVVLVVWLFGCLVVWLFGCLVVWLGHNPEPRPTYPTNLPDQPTRPGVLLVGWSVCRFLSKHIVK